MELCNDLPSESFDERKKIGEREREREREREERYFVYDVRYLVFSWRAKCGGCVSRDEINKTGKRQSKRGKVKGDRAPETSVPRFGL